MTSITVPVERPGWLGPLFGWDALRLARKGQLWLFRVGYAGILLGMLALVLGRGELTAKDLSYRTEMAMSWLLLLQLIAAILLTPATVAGVVLDERRQGT